MRPQYWDQAAIEAVLDLAPPPHIEKSFWASTDLWTSEQILRRQTDRSLRMFRERARDEELREPILQIGRTAACMLQAKDMWDSHEQWELLRRKQNDYGHKNIVNGGLPGVALRQADKVERYFNLKDRPDEAANEPLTDALLDMVGYAVIAAMLTTTLRGYACDAGDPDSRFLLELEPI